MISYSYYQSKQDTFKQKKYRILTAFNFYAESSLLQDNVAFVICLDSLGSGDELFLHVSRPPKPGTPQYSFIQQLEQIISARFPWVRFGTVHKKINLLETNVAWEHERYGMKHIPGFTLSHIENPKSELRGSILDTMAQVDIRKLKRNAVIVAESLARFMYNLSDKGSAKDVQVFKGSLDIQDSHLSALMTMMTSVPRAFQLLDKEPEHQLLINSLQQEFKHYLKQVHRHTFHQDRRYTQTQYFTSSLHHLINGPARLQKTSVAGLQMHILLELQIRMHSEPVCLWQKFSNNVYRHFLQKAKQQLTPTQTHI
ncbi:nicalin-1-like [Chanodichthys erythropterus]|uniref:nicalin-1-like n=1 Tax=Chanodichthys erythropterus TaxID=933992 RepID=UPI00351F61C4